ncbi:MAG: hypothetical protein JXQ29_12470 [Planctomycetes bacterium]|nr:hypothetical protein [Planctomycetota bacterium]
MVVRNNGALTLEVSDVSGQKRVRASDVEPDTLVGDFIRGAVERMGLPRSSTSGEPFTYHARLEREGRHLNAAERVGEALRPSDRIVLHPNVDAGARGPQD